jgi:hypothetical protein
MLSHISLTAAVALCATAGAAQANCKPLLDAMDKLGRQARVASYEVQNPEQRLAGEAEIVMIGKVVYDRMSGRWERNETDGVHPMVAHMRQQERSGGMQCVNVGSGPYRGSTVTKIRAENPSVQKKNRLVHIFWIDQASGLPLYQEAVGHKGGSAIVYGDAVKTPVVGK